MKPFFRRVNWILLAAAVWMTWVCAGLLTHDGSGNLMAGSYSVWGDWSAHFTFIESFRERGIHWIWESNPLFDGEPFRYPFLSHLFTAGVTFLFGGDPVSATLWISLALLFCLPFLIHRFYVAAGFQPRSALFGTLLFLFMGGWQWADSSLVPTEPLTNQFHHGSVFTQFVLFELFPQRAFLFGLTALTLLFPLSWKAGPTLSGKRVWIALAFGSLILLHVHSWMAAGALLLLGFLFPDPEGLPRKSTLLTGLLALIPSALGLWFVVLRDSPSHFSWDPWLPGWAQHPGAGQPSSAALGFLTFWVFNTGIFIPLAAIGIGMERTRLRFRSWAVAGVLLFLVPLFFNLQPYFYDNLKTFTYSFLFLAPFCGVVLQRLFEEPRIPGVLRSGLVALLLLSQTASALIDFNSFRQGLQSTVFFTEEEFALAERFKALRSSADALTVIQPRHNHWVPCLTGTPVLMGYAGWLWSWGISYSERERELKQILAGGPDADALIRKYRIRYVVLQVRDGVAEEGIGIPYFESRYPTALSSRNWRIYSIEDAAKSPSTSVR